MVHNAEKNGAVWAKKNDKRITSFVGESKNFKTINNHSAHALIKS